MTDEEELVTELPSVDVLEVLEGLGVVVGGATEVSLREDELSVGLVCRVEAVELSEPDEVSVPEVDRV